MPPTKKKPAQKKASTKNLKKTGSKSPYAGYAPVPEGAPYEMRSSKIHGLGLYAVRDIKKGEKIVEYSGEKITKAESERRAAAMLDHAKSTGGGAVYIFVLNKKYDIDGNVPENHARLINHSCDPNCEADIKRGKIWYLAKKNIKKGDEFGINYGFDLDHWFDHPCYCGTPGCVGFIVARDQWKKLRKEIAARQAVIDEGSREENPAGKSKEAAKSKKKRRK